MKTVDHLSQFEDLSRHMYMESSLGFGQIHCGVTNRGCCSDAILITDSLSLFTELST